MEPPNSRGFPLKVFFLPNASICYIICSDEQFRVNYGVINRMTLSTDDIQLITIIYDFYLSSIFTFFAV